MTFKSKDEFINFILISPHQHSFTQLITRFSQQFLPTPIHEFIQNQNQIPIITIVIGTTLAIILGFTFGPYGLYLRFIDRFKGLWEVLRYYDGFRVIAAAVRGEEVGSLDDQLNMEVKPMNRTMKRTIRELKPNQITNHDQSSSKLNPHQPNPIIKAELHYPGLINSSTNTCFLNAVLQSLASMPHLTSYLDLIHSYQRTNPQEKQTPVINSLREILFSLNTPKEFKTILRPVLVAQSLFKHGIETGNRFSLFNSEQQDAQEFLVIMIDAIESEVHGLIASIRLESTKFGSRHDGGNEIGRICRSPFRGLMVNRIACDTCGFTSVFRHSVADHFSLNVPPKLTCSLEECLTEYTKLELLEDYICRKCSLLKTRESLSNQVDELSNLSKEKLNTSKKKKLQGLKKDLKGLESMISNDDYESEMMSGSGKGLIERVASLATTKQTMFARPPDSLTFHISRSTAYARGVSFKNHCQVQYPEYLNLSSFCTTSILNHQAHLPISSKPKPNQAKEDEKLWYKLVSVVVHYGSHSFGHYITFRRIGKNEWLRISDESVLKSDLSEVLGANPFLIMYEKLHDPQREGEGQGDLLKCRKLHWFEV